MRDGEGAVNELSLAAAVPAGRSEGIGRHPRPSDAIGSTQKRRSWELMRAHARSSEKHSEAAGSDQKLRSHRRPSDAHLLLLLLLQVALGRRHL